MSYLVLVMRQYLKGDNTTSPQARPELSLGASQGYTVINQPLNFNFLDHAHRAVLFSLKILIAELDLT